MVRFCLLLTCSGIYTTSSVKLFCVIKQISSFWLLNVSSGLRTRGHISACRSGIYSCLSISLLQNKQLWNTEPRVWAGEGQFMKKSCFFSVAVECHYWKLEMSVPLVSAYCQHLGWKSASMILLFLLQFWTLFKGARNCTKNKTERSLMWS